MSPTAPGKAAQATTQDLAATFDRDGYVIVPQLYSGDEAFRIKQRFGEELKKLGHVGGVRVFMADTLAPDMLDLMRDDRVLPVLKRIVGQDIEFLSVKVVFKDSGTSFGSPWHQDWYYWLGAPKLSIWIALDDATPGNGCLMFIPGSHKKKYTNRYLEKEQAFVNRIMDADVKDEPVQTIDVKRGDAVFFSDLAVHSSHPNKTGADRWSLISTYRNAAVSDEEGAKVWKQPLLIAGKSVNSPR